MNEDAHLEAQYEERYEIEDDGPSGDFLGDYWFNHDGPDEPADDPDDDELCEHGLSAWLCAGSMHYPHEDPKWNV